MSESGHSTKKPSSRTKAGAGAAGAGSGTLLVLLANNLPDHSPWKSWLVVLAPSVSIGISVIYSWVRKAVDDYLEARKVKRFVTEAQQTLKEALENTNTSEPHRKRVRAQLEEREMLLVTTSIQRVKVADIPGLKPEPR